MNKETTNLKKEEIVRKWYVVDAANKPLGRLASEVATHLMGKQKPSWTPNQDCGDYIIVINCEKVLVSGNNVMTNKKYYNVSGYNGGMRVRTLKEMLENKNPNTVSIRVNVELILCLISLFHLVSSLDRKSTRLNSSHTS